MSLDTIYKEYFKFLNSLNDLEKYGMIITHTGIVREFSKRENRKKVKALYVDYREEDLKKFLESLKKIFPDLKIYIKIYKGERKVKEPIMFVAVASPFRESAFKALEFIIDTLKNKILLEKEIF